MHARLITLLLVAGCLIASTGGAATYSTDAIVSHQKDEGALNVDVRVSRMAAQDGKSSEQLVAAPKIQTAPGVPATLYTGLQPTDPDFASKENVTVDVSWPYPNESGTAFCAVTIKLGSEVVSRTKLQLKIEGPGRVPLVVEAQDIDPKSVRIVDEKSLTYVFVEFAGKTQTEVKKLAIENYGNKVQVRDLQGRLTEGGLSFGTYHETGMALHYSSKKDAERAASILRGKDSK